MFKIKTRKSKKILNGYPQPEIPNELSLMSKYELIWYIFALLIALFLFVRWHKISEREINITLDRLNYPHEDSIIYSSFTNIDLSIPMTYASSNYNEQHLAFSFNPSTQKYLHKLTTKYRVQPLHATKADSLLYNIDSILYINKLGTRDNKWHLYRFKIEQNLEDFHKLKSYKTTDELTYFPEGYVLKIWANGIKKGLFYKEQLIDIVIPENPDKEYTLRPQSKAGSAPLTKPKWYSLYDISQCYFTITFHTFTIDSINAVFDFVGATDFYEFDNLSTSKTASKIVYKLPLDDKDTCIKLYLRFKDLENIQTVRVFFITAVLGGLVTIFFAFIIIYIYRLFSKRRDIAALNHEIEHQ